MRSGPRNIRWMIAAIAAFILWVVITTVIARHFHIRYRAAGALIFLPLIPPVIAWAIWSKWRERRRRAQIREAVHGPGIIDPSHVRGLDIGDRDVN